MTCPFPTLRCLSCGYDIASLVEQRGRDEPGVCPECGDDLRQALLPRPGHAVQERMTIPRYVAFVRDSLRRPRELCRRVRLNHSGSGTFMLGNIVFGSISGGVGTALAQFTITSGPIDMRAAAALAGGVGSSVVLFMIAIVGLIPLALGASVFASAADWRFRGESRWLALDIGTAWWFSTGPCALLMFPAFDTTWVVGMIAGCILLISPFAAVVIATLRAMSMLQR